MNVTFSLSGDREPRLAAEPRPLTLDRPSRFAPHELERASDFVPQKGAIDLLVTGNAHSDRPAEAIPASFSLAGCARRFVAMASSPSARIPLSSAYLRASEGPPGEPVHVGPLAPHAPARRALALPQAPELDERGLPLGPLDGHFDFRFFNAAPPEQQLDVLPAGATLTLNGLLPGSRRRCASLPRVRPLVYVVDRQAERPPARLGLQCDTVLVDTTRAELSLVFRGAAAATPELEHALLLVGLEPTGTRWNSREIRQLLRQAWPQRAAEPEMPPSPAPGTAPASPPQREETRALSLQELGLRPVLPFRETGAAAKGGPAAPPAPSTPARPAWDEVTVTRPLERASLPGTGLPFRSTAERTAAPAPAPEADPMPAAPPVTNAPPLLVPPATDATDANRPLESRPRELLPIREYALIKLELQRDPGAGARVLERHGFDAVTWQAQERLQLAALAGEARQGRSTRAAGLMTAMRGLPARQSPAGREVQRP